MPILTKQKFQIINKEMDKFKVFLLNEEKSYLGRKVAGVLTPMQELQDDMENMGARHLVRVAERLVNEIRKILHGHWEQQQQQYLKELQRIKSEGDSFR